MTTRLSTVNILRNQIKIEKEDVAEYRRALKWVMLGVEQGLISKENIIEEIGAVLDYGDFRNLPAK